MASMDFLNVFLFWFVDGLQYVEEIRLNKCMYIEDACLEKLSSVENLQESLCALEVVSCGNVTDKGIIALHKLRDLPGLKEKDKTVERLKNALPRLAIDLDLD